MWLISNLKENLESMQYIAIWKFLLQNYSNWFLFYQNKCILFFPLLKYFQFVSLFRFFNIISWQVLYGKSKLKLHKLFIFCYFFFFSCAASQNNFPWTNSYYNEKKDHVLKTYLCYCLKKVSMSVLQTHIFKKGKKAKEEHKRKEGKEEWEKEQGGQGKIKECVCCSQVPYFLYNIKLKNF